MSGVEAFCVGACTNAAGTLIVDYLVKPIDRRIRYMFRFKDIVKDFQRQKVDLSTTLTQMGLEVGEATSQIQEIEEDVVNWLEDARKLSEDNSLETEVEENKKCLKCCPNWIWRYGLSKKIDKMTEAIEVLVERSNKFKRVGHPAPLPGNEFHTKGFMASESSTRAYNEIMEALEDGKVSMIGVWGMGGVGKTTLVKQVANQLKLESHSSFDHVVMATVSQTPIIGEIQSKIADILSLKLDKHTDAGKAEQLWVGIKEKKRVLIILDDVWKELSLKEIGIPVGQHHSGCKVVLTTRYRHVCGNLMQCEAIVPLGLLEEDEAWKLFKMNADLGDASPKDIVDVAREVVQECGGLPIALVTLARALRGKTRNGWQLARDKLKKARLMDIESIPKEVPRNAYMSLEISYNDLPSDTTKKCFLMCALFPEDYSINVEELVTFAWGLRLYQCACSIEEVRREVFEAIENLKDRCLLLEDKERHVKLHDMVRDVALWTASKEESGFIIKSDLESLGSEGFEACRAISLLGSNKPKEFPKNLVCPKLEILLLNNDICDEPITCCFGGIQELKVLSVTSSSKGVFSLTALSSLTDLRALQLEGFKRLEDMSSLANLMKLEIIRLCGAEIVGVVDELEKLANLKVLDLSKCNLLSRFSPNLFQKLCQLEELYLRGLKTKMNLDDILLKNLKFFSRLAVLTLDLPKCQGFPKGFAFPRLQRYGVALNSEGDKNFDWIEATSLSSRLYLRRTLPLGVIAELLWNIECLRVFDIADIEHIAFLTDKISTPQHIKVPGERILENLKEVRLERCENLQVVFQITKGGNDALPLLSKLEHLSLKHLPNLSSIWELPTPKKNVIKLEHLVELSLSHCPSLVSLFPLSLAQSLIQLEKLEISDCPKLKEIVVMETDDEGDGISHCCLCFPKLTTLEIHECGGLEYLFPKSMSMAPQRQGLPQLKWLDISHCDQLSQLVRVRPSKERDEEKLHLTSLTELRLQNCPKLTESTLHIGAKEAYLQLKEMPLSAIKEWLISSNIKEAHLWRIGMDGMDNLIPDGIADGLNGLTSLELSGCEQGVKCLVDTTKENYNKYVPTTNCAAAAIFTSLEKLELVGMADLEKLYEVGLADQSLKDFLPNLKSFTAKRCEKMVCISPIAKSQYLQEVYLWDLNMLEEVFKIDELLVDNSSSMELAQPQPQPLLLSHLQSLRLWDLAGLTRIILELQGGGHINQLVSLRSLKVICVEKCHKLKFLFSASLAQTLVFLQQLIITECRQLETIFFLDKRDEEISDTTTTSFPIEFELPCLKELRLEFLENCSSFCPQSSLVKTPALEELTVRGCPRLTNFPIQQVNKRIELQGTELSAFRTLLCECDTTSAELLLFLKGIFGDVKNVVPDAVGVGAASNGLTHLYILNCNQLEFLVDTTKLQQQEQVELAIFSDLVELRMVRVKSLKMLCNPKGGQLPNPKSFLQNLKLVRIIDCGELQGTLFPNSEESNYLQCLKFVTIRKCKGLRSVFPLSLVKTLRLLQQLEISECAKLESLFSDQLEISDDDDQEEEEEEEYFPWLLTLETLEVVDCPALKYLLPSPMATLPQLISIKIERCPLIEQVFKLQQEYSDDDDEHVYGHGSSYYSAALLPKLQSLQLDGLRIDNLEILESPFSLNTNFTTASSSTQVTGKLPQSTVQICRDIWNGPIQFEGKLRELVLSNCNQLRYICPIMLLTHCPQLNVLQISHCSNLVQVITRGHDEIDQISTSSSSSKAKKLLSFPQIQQLSLQSLPNLVSFCPEGYHLEFPYLESLKVIHCPRMITSFTLDYSKLAVHVETEENEQLQETQSESPRDGEDIDWDYKSGEKGLPPYRNIKRRAKGKSPL